MKHETKHFEIHNVVLLSALYAQKPANKKEDAKLYKLWCATTKDNLRNVLEEAYRPNEIDNQDVFEFCEVVEATGKVQRALRLCGYENTTDYVTFDVTSWNKPFTCDKVDDFNSLEMQEFTITCDLSYKNIPVRDADGHMKYNSRGKILTKNGGSFNATSTFIISDLDLDTESFDE